VLFFQFKREPDGFQHFTYLSEGILGITQNNVEELCNNADLLFQNVHEEDINELLRSIDESAENLTDWLFNFRVRKRKNKGYRWFRGNAIPTKNRDRSISWNGTFIDISEIKKATEEIELSKSRYYQLFDKNPLAMMVVDKNTFRFLEVNSTAIKQLKFTEEELLNMNLFDVLAEEHQPKMKKAISNLNRKDAELFVINFRKNYERFDAHVFLTNFTYKGGDAFLKIITDISEQKQAQEQIQRQNIFFEELFNASPFGIVLLDEEEKIIQVNRGFENLFGYKSEEIKNEKLIDFIVPEHLHSQSKEIFEDAKRKGHVQRESLRKRKDGSVFDSLIVRYPIIQQDDVLGYYGIYLDISSQKAAERELLREKHFVDGMINSLPGIVYVIRENNTFKLWNENLRKVSEYTDEEIAQIAPSDLFEGQDKEIIIDRITKVFTEGKSEAEASIVSKTGKITPYYFTGVLSEINQERFVIGMGMDITERILSDETLRIQKRALESVAEGVMITDALKPDNPIIFVNSEFTRITGYTQEEVLGKSSRFLQGRRTSRRMVAAIREAIRNKENFRGELLNYRKDGSAFWNLLIISPVFNKDNQVTHYVGTINDISDIKKWQQELLDNNQELQKINEELDRFVYSTSHDLRAPLTSVLGLINIALSENDPKLIQQFLLRMKNSIIKLDNFIQDIVNYSRNSRLEIEPVEISFEKKIKEIINELQFMEGAENIQFRTSISESVAFYSDNSRINVILNNLISNAIKYRDRAKSDHTVHISIETNSKKAIIKIEDNGQGIPPQYQKKVFQMFFRASEKSTGSGLGLYIVKEMVDKLKGTIKLQSEPGKGAIFTIELPNFKIKQE
jgi:PAS domain S-box-containing protein